MDEMLRIAVFGDSLMKGTLPDEQLRYHFHTDLSRHHSPACTPR